MSVEPQDRLEVSKEVVSQLRSMTQISMDDNGDGASGDAYSLDDATPPGNPPQRR